MKGTLHVTEYQDGLLIRGDLTGLGAGKHGFHIHETGNTSNNCAAAGPHFNPVNVRDKLPMRLRVQGEKVGCFSLALLYLL